MSALDGEFARHPAFSAGLTAHVGPGVHVGSVGCGERSEPHRSGKMTGRERCGSLWSPHPTRRGISGQSLVHMRSQAEPGNERNTTGAEAGRYRIMAGASFAGHLLFFSVCVQISFLLSSAIDRLSGSAYSRVPPIGMPKAIRDTLTRTSWS